MRKRTEGARAKAARASARPELFVGPTIAVSAEARALAKKGYRVRRPIRRGDVDALLAEKRKAPGTIVIVDGVFQDTLAVGHAELREALTRGWEVWGLSSMGAIRAREMTHLGMRGFGEVFARFNAEGDFQDDEVALLHEARPPYRPVSEPLIHLRAAVDHLTARGVVGADEGRSAIEDLKERWYGERTLRRAVHALKERAPACAGEIEEELHDFDRFRLKTIDLVAFLRLPRTRAVA